MLTDAPTPAEGAPSPPIARISTIWRRARAAFGRTQTTDASTFRIVIFRAESAEAARRIMADDPAIAAGVMRSQVFPFRVGRVGPGLASPV
jgi:hypothetical protein